MHIHTAPSILYFGTPVVIISSENEDGSFNLAPISSAFWLGWRCVIGIGVNTKTAQNLSRTKQCVLNLPSVNEASMVNSLALTTGASPVPERKIAKGYRYEKDKFNISGATPIASEIVRAPRVEECPVHLEATVAAINPVGEDDHALRNRIVSIELKMERIHIEQSILMEHDLNRVDPDKWRPLIMSFQQFYGLGQQVHPSSLAQIPERSYSK